MLRCLDPNRRNLHVIDMLLKVFLGNESLGLSIDDSNIERVGCISLSITFRPCNRIENRFDSRQH